MNVMKVSVKFFSFILGVVMAASLICSVSAAEESYQLDISGVEIGDTTSGRGIVLTEENDPGALYVRVTWVYDMSDGQTFAFCAVKDVMADEGGMLYFKMVGPSAPPSCTLISVRMALVTDEMADASGAYNALALAAG